MPTQLELNLYPEEIDVNFKEIPGGYLIGKAKRRNDGKWVALANVISSPVIVELKISFLQV